MADIHDFPNRGRASEGRYDPKRKALMPSNGLASAARPDATPLARAIVPDPMEPNREVYVSVNRHVDILEQERSHKRISEAAYRVGREIQAIFEKATRVGSGSQWREGDRVDADLAKEHAILRNVDNARLIVREMVRLRREVGMIGACFLRDILVANLTFQVYANRTSRGTRRDVDRVAARFRDMLEDIVRMRSARGYVPPSLFDGGYEKDDDEAPELAMAA